LDDGRPVLSADPPDRIELAPVLVPVQRSGGAAGRRARVVVAGWILGLAGVAALGLSGQEPAPESAVVPAAVPVPSTSSSPAPPAPTIERLPLPRIVGHPITYHRALGKDGLVGGIVFGNNIRQPEEPD
jgi:hypothetical protein